MSTSQEQDDWFSDPRIIAITAVCLLALTLGVIALWVILFRPPAPPREKALYTSSEPMDLPAVLEVWRQVSASNGILPEAVESVAEIVEQKMAQTLMSIPASDALALQRAMREMIDGQQLRYRPVEEASSTGYLLALFLDQAMVRAREPATVSVEELEKNHRALVDAVVDLVEKNLRAAMTEDQLRKFNRKINANMAQLRQRMHQQVAALREDYLFPAFKTPFTEKQVGVILDKFDRPERFDDRYDENRLDAIVQNYSMVFGFTASLEQMRYLLLDHPYVEDMLPGFEGVPTTWPTRVKFRYAPPPGKPVKQPGSEAH